jgi:quinol monooxygenase YgiN
MYARISTFKISTEKIDAATQRFQEFTLPQLRKLDGFKGATMLVDRDRGMFRVVGFWEDMDAVDASEQGVRDLRQDIFEKLDAEVVATEAWEVTVDFYPEAAREMAGSGAAAAR